MPTAVFLADPVWPPKLPKLFNSPRRKLKLLMNEEENNVVVDDDDDDDADNDNDTYHTLSIYHG